MRVRLISLIPLSLCGLVVYALVGFVGDVLEDAVSRLDCVLASVQPSPQSFLQPAGPARSSRLTPLSILSLPSFALDSLR